MSMAGKTQIGQLCVSWGALLCSAALFTNCAIGPKYTRPSLAVPSVYKELAPDGDREWKAAHPSDAASRGNWWEPFNDPELNRLEDRLAKSNYSIAAAAANVQAARAVMRGARAQYFPTITTIPAVTNSRLSTGFGQTIGRTFTTYSFPLNASWEPDLWGRIRKTISGNSAAAQASAADLENVRLSAQAELAADYFQLREQDALKELWDALVTAYQESAALDRDQYMAGIGSDETVAQAEAQLHSAIAQDTNLAVARAQYEHAIAVLVGEPASTFSILAAQWEADPPSIPAGIPSELLERRPDIASAERAVAQANAQIGISKTAFFPILTLTASGGFENTSIAQWLQWPSRIWSVGPSLAETLFDAGLRRATVEQFQATYDQTVANYRQTVLTAFQEVEDYLAALRTLAGVIQQQAAAIEAAKRTFDIAKVRYEAGLDPYLNVLMASITLLADQQTAATFEMQQMVAIVQLIKALGGGWDISQMPSPEQLERRNPRAFNEGN